MCGIGLYWAKESVLTHRQYDLLFRGAEKRGQDGFGVVILRPDLQVVYQARFDSYAEARGQLYLTLRRNLTVGGLVIFSSRATPETENTTASDSNNIQPIVYPDIILAHNGGVTDAIANAYCEGVQRLTTLDSEAIIIAYQREQKNMRTLMERLSGSFAFIMIDKNKKGLYAVTSFNPLAHMYIKGAGYFLHSDLSVLEEVLAEETGSHQDGISVWESWYHHYIEGYTIIETDLSSGFQRKHKYEPYFIHPHWSKKFTGKKKTLVVSSGGVDSGVTAAILKEAEYDVELVHFDYGQRSNKAERWACSELGEQLGLPVNIHSLIDFYADIEDNSFLFNEEMGSKLTGGNLIKSTVAWVAGRNAIFATMVMAIAESKILKGECDEVYIAAGWNQLSEETGGYPDNSFQFNQALEMLKMYGYITGSRIKFLPVLQRLTKTETWFLGSQFDFPFQYTVSCDAPTMHIMEDAPRLCTECGSTRLSIIAADRAGVVVKRKFIGERPTLSSKMKLPDINDIIARLLLPLDKIQLLKLKLLLKKGTIA